MIECPACGKDIYIHRPTETYACTDPACNAQGSVEMIGLTGVDTEDRLDT